MAVLILFLWSFNLCFIKSREQWSTWVKAKVMLFPFTMQQFLIMAVVLTLTWYGGVFLWFYRRRGAGLDLRSSGAARLRPALPGKGSRIALEQESFDEDLMGKAKLPEGMELISSEELRFADPIGRVGEAVGVGHDDQLGLIPDVLEEIKEVFGMLAKEDGTKVDFLGMMRAVKEKYPRISSHPGLAGLNSYIRDHAAFHISVEELNDLWD